MAGLILSAQVGRLFSFPLRLLVLCGGTHSGSERSGEDVDILSLPVMQPRFVGCPARSFVTVLTELFWIYLSAEAEENHRQKARAG
jgi:hypothetical protein